jgi:hypothetical protein
MPVTVSVWPCSSLAPNYKPFPNTFMKLIDKSLPAVAIRFAMLLKHTLLIDLL